MNHVPKVFALKCVTCGASLEISPDAEQVACSYCGTRQVVQRGDGSAPSLKPLHDAIARVQAGTDRTAAELAVRRLRDDMANLQTGKQRLEQELAQARHARGQGAARFQQGDKTFRALVVIAALTLPLALLLFAASVSLFTDQKSYGFGIYFRAWGLTILIGAVAAASGWGAYIRWKRNRQVVDALSPAEVQIAVALEQNQQRIEATAAQLKKHLANLGS